MKKLFEGKDDVHKLLTYIDNEFKKIRKDLKNNKVVIKYYYEFMENNVYPWIDEQAFLDDGKTDPRYEREIIDLLLDFLNELKTINGINDNR